MSKKLFLTNLIVLCALSAFTQVTTFNYTGSMQTYTVPPGVTSIQIEAYGAQGGNTTGQSGVTPFSGGLGASATGTFAVTPGQVFNVLVGGQGGSGGGGSCGTGGGGGSFVVLQGPNTPYIIAGGGGGAFHCNALCGYNGGAGQAATTSGGGIACPGRSAHPGVAGPNGGLCTGYGASGGGFATNGQAPFGGGAVAGNAYPGAAAGNGGYGGGGGGYTAGCCGSSGGGGGYAGGSSSQGSDGVAGGGGASYNTGTSQTNLSGVRSGNGQVVITELVVAVPEINVQGNGNNIVDGDATPSLTDHTDYGSVLACSGTIVRTFTIQNTGSASLTISSINITGTNASDFSVTGSPGTPVGVAGSTTLSVTFDPSATGLRTATITINSNDADETAYDFAIQGTGDVDVTAPVADVASLSNATGECSVNLTAPTATDNCAGSVLATTADPTSYSAEGSYMVTWTYNDGNGNSSTQTQNVIVDDVTAPVANVGSLPTVNGSCSATVSSTPTATDNCNGTVTGTTNDSLTYNSEGTYMITWTYNDGNGNTSTQIQTVVVDDVTSPVADLSVLPDVTGSCSATISSDPTATDNCSGTITGTTTDPLNYATAGTYTITWTYDDGNGNTSSQTQQVIVSDTGTPVPDVSPLPNVVGDCTVDVTTFPTATDNCVGTITGTTGDALNYTTPGFYIITWEFDDGNGNTETQNQTVIVNPCLGVNSLANSMNIILYPNPNNGSFTLSLGKMPAGSVTLRIWNSMGQAIYNTVLASESQQFDFSYLKAGTYYLQVLSDQDSYTQSMIITQKN